MADQLKSLVKELKALNARKKAGEELTPQEDERRRKLKRYLRSALEKDKGGAGGTAEGPAQVSGLDSGMMSAEQSKKAGQRGYAIAADDLIAKAAASTEGPAEDFAVHEAEEDPAPAPAEPAPPKKDYSKAFALDAGALFEAAEGSAAVAAAAPEPVPGAGGKGAPRPSAAGKLSAADFQSWLQETGSKKGMRNSSTAIEEVVGAADRALQQNKTRERASTADEVKDQLADILGHSGYTPPEHQLALEQYYGEYVEADGFAVLEEGDSDLDLATIDPREIELYRSGLLGDDAGNEAAPVPSGLAFLDDFPALYELGVLPQASEEISFDSDDPNLLIPGKRKVTVHLLNGQVKRGAIRSLARDDAGFRLEPSGTGRAEDIPLQHCKAIFVHKPSKAPEREVRGQPLTVMFKDRRSVQGVSDDYQPGAAMFSLVPQQQRGAQGQFERIIVNAGAVKQVR